MKQQLIRLGSQNPDLQKHIRPVLDRLASRPKYPLPPDAEPGVDNQWKGSPYDDWGKWENALEKYVLEMSKNIHAGSKTLYERMSRPKASRPAFGLLRFNFQGWPLTLFTEGWRTLAENDGGKKLYSSGAISEFTIEMALNKIATDIHKALEPV